MNAIKLNLMILLVVSILLGCNICQMKVKNYLGMFIFLFISFNNCYSQIQSIVFESGGNIYFRNEQGLDIKLTSLGLDLRPVLSKNCDLVAFVRKTPNFVLEAATDDVITNEIWIVKTNGENLKRVVKGRQGNSIEEFLGGFANLNFSNDCTKIFFMGRGWVTSNSIHVVDLNNLEVKFISDSNHLEIIRKGRYKGCLILRKHKYWMAGGSYDWFWLVTPNGEEIGPIGPEYSFVETLKDLYED